MSSSEKLLSEVHLLQIKIREYEQRVSQLLMKQLQTKKELDLIKEIAATAEDPMQEQIADPEGKLLEGDLSADQLGKVLADMISTQESMQRYIEETRALRTGLGGLEIFDEISQNVGDRLKYLDAVDKLLKGPLLEEPPAPPEEEIPAEEPEPEQKEVESVVEKPKKGAGKKGKNK